MAIRIYNTAFNYRGAYLSIPNDKILGVAEKLEDSQGYMFYVLQSAMLPSELEYFQEALDSIGAADNWEFASIHVEKKDIEFIIPDKAITKAMREFYALQSSYVKFSVTREWLRLFIANYGSYGDVVSFDSDITNPSHTRILIGGCTFQLYDHIQLDALAIRQIGNRGIYWLKNNKVFIQQNED